MSQPANHDHSTEPESTDLANLRQHSELVKEQLAEANRRLQEQNEQLIRQSRRLAALNEITAATSAHIGTDPDKVFQIAAREMQAVLPFDRVSVALYDAEASAMRVYDVQTERETALDDGHALPLEGTGVGYVIRTGNHLFATDISQSDAQTYLEYKTLAQEGLRSVMSVPLQRGKHVTGSLNVASQQPGAYDQDDLALLYQIADQIAVAMQNIRLFSEAQQRLQEQTMLFNISQALSEAPLQAEEIAAIVARHLVAAMNIQECSVSLYDPETDTLHVLADFIREEEDIFQEYEIENFRLTDYPATARAMKTLQPLVVQASDLDADPAELAYMHQYNTVTLVVIPMAIKGQAIGVIELEAEDYEHHYTSQELNLAMTIANQAAVAMENARLLEQTQAALSLLDSRVRELNCLNDIGRKIDENPPISEFLEWVAGRIPPAMRYSEDCLAAINLNGQIYGAAEAVQLPNQIVGSLYIDKDRIGQVIIAYTEEHEFIDEESALLGDITRRVSGYIENQRLLEQSQYRATRFQAAAEVSRAASGILDPDELIQKAVSLAQERFELYYAGLFLVDQTGEWTGEPNKWAVLRAGTGRAGEQMMAEGHKLEVGGESMIGSCVAGAQARIALDVGTEAQRFDNPHLPQTRSEMAMPLIARDQAIGAMTIQSEQAAAFSEEDISILQIMADQVAVAIQNGRLYQQSITLYLAAQAISQATTLDEALDSAANYVVDPLYDTCALLTFSDPDQRDTLGVIATWTTQDATPLPIGTVINQRRFPLFKLVTQPEIVIVDDLSHDSRIDAQLAQRMTTSGVQSIISIPLVVGPTWLGLFLAQGPHPTALGPEERRAFESLANQLAAFIQTTRLLDETQQALEQVQQLHRRQIRETWQDYLLSTDESKAASYLLEQQQMIPNPDLKQPEIELALRQNRTVVREKEGAAVIVPISLRGQVIGTLGIEDPTGEQRWSEDDIALLEAVTAQLALAIDNARLSEQTQASLAETQTLFETSRSLAAAQEMEEIWQAVVEAARQRRADACALFLFDTLERDTAHELVLASGWDRQGEPRLAIGTHLPLSNFGMFDALRPDRPFLVTNVTAVDDIDKGAQDLLTNLGFSALIHQPIAVRGRWFGFLTILYESSHRFVQAEIDFYRTLADQAALAIESQRLLDETQRRAEREQLIRQITTKVRATSNIETILQTTAQELSKALGLPRAFVRLGTEDQLKAQPVKPSAQGNLAEIDQ